MRLIDADNLKSMLLLDKYRILEAETMTDYIPIVRVFEIINAVETIDFEKHGKWTETKEHAHGSENTWEWTNFYCSECDAPSDTPYEFCPYCGAKMDGE